ncbi:MAG: hypothetical protein JJU02_10480 [Cryomorphaceae bacterium]|nr:hypothetical protein [Cryomorphaceae bacterium]
MRLPLLMFVALFFFAFECERERPEFELPLITQSGENTLGAIVDGEIWIPFRKGMGGLMGSPPLYSAYLRKNEDSTNYDLNIHASQFRPDDTTHKSTIEIRATIPSIANFSDTIYLITENSGHYSIRPTLDDPLQNFRTLTSGSKQTNWLHIHHLDTIEQIVAGTFFFDAVNEQRTVELRDGRFDFRYE